MAYNFYHLSASSVTNKTFLTVYIHIFSLAGGRAADPGQVPREEGGAEGAVREGTPGGLLPRQVLGRPQYQYCRRFRRLLRRNHHVSYF